MTPPAMVLILAGAAGACAGSACITLALRRVAGDPRIGGRSSCPSCQAILGYVETIPLLSYARRAGTCGGCGVRIDPLHPLGEAAGTLLVAAPLAWTPWPAAPILIALGFVLLTTSVIDLKTHRLPDTLTLLGTVACLTLASLQGRGAVLMGAATAAVVVLVLGALRLGFSRARGDAGLGLGDVKLAAALALWLGPAISWALVIASAAALAGARLSQARGRMAFGPYLATAAWIVGVFQASAAYRLSL